MSYRKFFLALLLVAILACNGSYKQDGVLPRKKIIPILVDIHLAEAINNQKYNISMTRDSLPEELYLSICKKYKVERSVIEKSLLYYGKHPEEYISIYNEVLDVLSELEVKAKNDTLRTVHVGGFNLDTAKTSTIAGDTLKNALQSR